MANNIVFIECIYRNNLFILIILCFIEFIKKGSNNGNNKIKT